MTQHIISITSSLSDMWRQKEIAFTKVHSSHNHTASGSPKSHYYDERQLVEIAKLVLERNGIPLSIFFDIRALILINSQGVCAEVSMPNDLPDAQSSKNAREEFFRETGANLSIY